MTGKRTTANVKLVDPAKVYKLEDGIKLLKSAKGAKFDETVNIAINLGIDVKKTEQSVRGAISLPHGTGRSLRVCAPAARGSEKRLQRSPWRPSRR